ncbi:Putative RNA-binding protein 11 [Tupaia chinensis]|uniref:Putative RNA-binding protein 11 n=1 Tax=Tupaia chinensis TaxID=246437 RepID=L9KMA3_TUPCH|nr:Putative RNA-binding protein 11 [Tupaia chinensis]
MFPAQEEADRTVFVGNLEARVREEILYELFLQQWQAYNPMLPLPYEMTGSLPNSSSVSSSLNHVPDLEAGPSSYEWTHQQPSDSDLYQINTRKRQRQTSDSDSSTENSRGNEYNPKFRRCKKKRY